MFNHTTVTFDDCVLAYDLDEQKYLFISPGVCPVLGISAKQLYQNNSLWDELIPQKNLAGIKNVIQNLTPNIPVELSYHINTAPHRVKNITDKKTLIIDEATGHKILLSEIKEDTSKNHLVTESGKTHHWQDDGHSQQFLNSLIDSQTSFLIRIDTNGNYSFVNRQYLKTFGYTAEYLLGHHFSITTIPQEAHLCQNVFVQCLKNPGKIIPLLHKKPDVYGNLHDTEWEFISIVDENGAVCEIQGIGQDVTERLKNETEIKNTAQKLDSFIESITDSFFIVDNNWRFVRVNAAFEKTGNKSRHELLGKVIWDVFPSLVNTGFEFAYQQALAKKESVKFIEYFQHSNRWFSASVYPSLEGLAVFIKDITAEKLAQEDALYTKNSLEALINNTNDQIWSVDADSRYVYMNHAYVNQIAQLTGVAPKEGDYSYMHQGFSNRAVDDWKSYYKRALNGEQYTITLETRDKQIHKTQFFEINFNPIYTQKNEIIGVGCFARNITRRLKTEQELLDQNTRLRNIASLSSHELRRPVANMMGLIDLMDRKNFYNPENEQIIKHLLAVSTEFDGVIRLIVDNTFTGD